MKSTSTNRANINGTRGAKFFRSITAITLLLVSTAISTLATTTALADTTLAEIESSNSLDKDQITKYIRIRKNAEGQLLSLDTSVVSFVPTTSITKSPNPAQEPTLVVDLVSAVHIGEKEYYETLNKLFSRYDVVLYELIAPTDQAIPDRSKSDASAISGVQQKMKDLLELEFQLEKVEYDKSHFVHADLSPEQFMESMNKRDESFLSLALKIFASSMVADTTKKPGAEIGLLIDLFKYKPSLALKRLLAIQMEDMSVFTDIFVGPEGSTIITDRNDRALEVLTQQLQRGKKKIAIFYGAGHMPDFENKLRSNYALDVTSVSWIPAWRLQQ